MARAAATNSTMSKKKTIRQHGAHSSLSNQDDKFDESPKINRDSIMSKKTTPVRTLSPKQKSIEKDASVFKNTNIVSKLSEKEIRIQVVSDGEGQHSEADEMHSPDKIKPLLRSRDNMASSMKSKSEKIFTPVKPQIVPPKVETKNNYT